jgi:hypothetical protein
MENTLKHREIREHKRNEILWALVIFFTNHSIYKYSVCHKLLNMQNIYTLPSILVWKFLIPHHVSSLNITTVFPLTTLILHLFLATGNTAVREMKRQLEFTILRVITFCILFKLYANSNNTTKLNYMATSIPLLLVSHDAVKCHMSVDLTILTTIQWTISQYEWEYNNITLCMDIKSGRLTEQEPTEDQRGKVYIQHYNQNSLCGRIIIRDILWVVQTASPTSCVYYGWSKLFFRQLLCYRCFFHYSPEHCSFIT